MLTNSDKLHIVFIAIADGLAVLINICLILAIIIKTPKPLRAYSVFLLNNAIIDIASAIVSMLGTVRLVEDHEGGSMIYVFLGPCSIISEKLCRASQGLHFNLVFQSTIILLISFGYRLYIL
ncbi:hypothetical protein PMAYCL1PPCAC_15656, partial [Pristionchus mayeri]